MATIVDLEALWQTVAAALVGGVGVAFAFSVAILGATRSAEATREGQPVLAMGFAALGVAGLAATAAAITFGIIVMTSK